MIVHACLCSHIFLNMFWFPSAGYWVCMLLWVHIHQFRKCFANYIILALLNYLSNRVSEVVSLVGIYNPFLCYSLINTLLSKNDFSPVTKHIPNFNILHLNMVYHTKCIIGNKIYPIKLLTFELNLFQNGLIEVHNLCSRLTIILLR